MTTEPASVDEHADDSSRSKYDDTLSIDEFRALDIAQWNQIRAMTLAPIAANDPKAAKNKAWIAAFALSAGGLARLKQRQARLAEERYRDRLAERDRTIEALQGEASRLREKEETQREHIRTLMRERDEGRLERQVRAAVEEQTRAIRNELAVAKHELYEANRTIEQLRADKRRLKAARRQ